jgi:hypothetical protein
MVIEIESSSVRIYETEGEADEFKIEQARWLYRPLGQLHHAVIVAGPSVGICGWPGDPIKPGKADVFIPAIYGNEMSRGFK